MNIEY